MTRLPVATTIEKKLIGWSLGVGVVSLIVLPDPSSFIPSRSGLPIRDNGGRTLAAKAGDLRATRGRR